MKRFLRLNKKVTALATVAGLLLATVSAFGWFVGGNGEITLCIAIDPPHAVRALDVNAGESCLATEETVVINQQGPAGPAGPAGPQGPAGAQGAAGPQGPAGVTSVLAVHRQSGPNIPTAATATVITMSNVPPGNYVKQHSGANIPDAWRANGNRGHMVRGRRLQLRLRSQPSAADHAEPIALNRLHRAAQLHPQRTGRGSWLERQQLVDHPH